MVNKIIFFLKAVPLGFFFGVLLFTAQIGLANVVSAITVVDKMRRCKRQESSKGTTVKSANKNTDGFCFPYFDNCTCDKKSDDNTAPFESLNVDLPSGPQCNQELEQMVPGIHQLLYAHSNYDRFPFHALSQVMSCYNRNVDKLKNKNCITIFDMTQNIKNCRKWILCGLDETPNNPSISCYISSHGAGNDRVLLDANGKKRANQIDVPGSYRTQSGYYIAGESYDSQFPKSAVRLYGLEEKNKLAYCRAVVVHGYDYEKFKKAGMKLNPPIVFDPKDHIPTSEGCPAVFGQVHGIDTNINQVVAKIKGDSLYYIYSELEASKGSECPSKLNFNRRKNPIGQPGKCLGGQHKESPTKHLPEESSTDTN